MPDIGDIILWKKPREEIYGNIGVMTTPFKVRSSSGEQPYPIKGYECNILPMKLDKDQKRSLLSAIPGTIAPDYNLSQRNSHRRLTREERLERDWLFVQRIIREGLHFQVNQWQDLMLRQEHLETYSETIFVSIPSYRDPECFNTIKSLWTKATQPHKIYVGVCQQNSDEDDDVGSQVQEMFPSLYENNFFILRLDAGEATGPCLAREMIENFLYDNQDFVLMIDSHTTFREDWDTRLIHEWNMAQDPNAIITTYPNQYGSGGEWVSRGPTFLKARKWGFVKFPVYIQGRYKEPPSKPVPSIVMAAGFCFMPRKVIEKAPYVTNVPFSFIGEETVMAIKYFTNGFNLYSPTDDIVETSFDRTARPNFREVVRTEKDDIRAESNRRLLDIACGRIPSELGKERLVEEYYEYSGMDIRNGSLNSFSQHGITKRDTHEDAYSKWGKNMSIIYKAMAIRR